MCAMRWGGERVEVGGMSLDTMGDFDLSAEMRGARESERRIAAEDARAEDARYAEWFAAEKACRGLLA